MMKAIVFALTAWAAFAAASPVWAVDQAAIDRGAHVYALWCGYCHDAVSAHQKMLAGTYTLQQRYKGSKPAALVDRTDMSPAFVKTIVRRGLNIMPYFRKTEISDAELDDLAAFLTQNKPSAP